MRRHTIGWAGVLAAVALIGCGGGNGGGGSSAATDEQPTIPRAGSTQTTRPTRTPGAFPTPTQGTPSGTATGTPATPQSGTATRTLPGTATPTATIVPQGIVRIAPASGDPGERVTVEVRLADIAPGVSIVATQNDLYFDPTQVRIDAAADGRPDCVANPAIGKDDTQFGFLSAGCPEGASCGAMRAVVLSLTNLDPIPSGSLLYICNASIAPTARRGTFAHLACAMAGASDPAGREVAVGCPDGWIEIADRPFAPQGTVDIASVHGAPGESVALDVSLTDVAPGVSIAAMQNDIYFDPTQLAFAATSGGRPDCAVNPALGKEATVFGFQPPGCLDDDSCIGIRALVLSYRDLSAIPSGSLLYTCNVTIAANALPGASALLCAMPLGSDADGQAIPVECPDSGFDVVLDDLLEPTH